MCWAALQQSTLLGVFHTDRPSSAEHDILSAEKKTPEQLGARLHFMSDDMGDHAVMIALLPGPRARGRSPPATTTVKKKNSVLALGFLELGSLKP